MTSPRSSMSAAPQATRVVPFRADAAAELDAWVQQLPPAVRAHARSQEIHFVQRARERFGLTVSPQRYRHWIRKVEEVHPGTEFIAQGDRPERTLWRIRSGSYTLHVCYDETTRRLVTCYTPSFTPVSAKRRHRLRRRFIPGEAGFLEKTRRLAAA